MKYRAVVPLLALAISCSAVAAEKQSKQNSQQQQRYVPSLAFVMQLIQLSHFKLWLAGNLRNWRLAEYELSQMKATLQDAKNLFRMIPKQTLAGCQPRRFAMRSRRRMELDSTGLLKNSRQLAIAVMKAWVWNSLK